MMGDVRRRPRYGLAMAQDPIKLRRPGPRLAGWMIAGAAVLAVAIWWSFGISRPPATPAPVASVAPAAPSAPTPAPQSPSFDIVRVNPQGAAVIAGRAAPDSDVTLQQNGQTIGRAKTDAQGQFVVLPDKPLAPGGQELTLSSRSPGQADVAGAAPVLVVVPPSQAPSQTGQAPVAVLAPADAPARLLQGTGTALALGVVDYDAKGAIRLSGTAAPGSKLRLYIDDAAVGAVTTNNDGSWAFTPSADVAAGNHRLRLDLLGPDGKVASRIETPFTRVPGSEMAMADGQTVVVQPGDSLWRIASRRYGHGTRYTEIFSANASKIRDPDLIYPGQLFSVPNR